MLGYECNSGAVAQAATRALEALLLSPFGDRLDFSIFLSPQSLKHSNVEH